MFVVKMIHFVLNMMLKAYVFTTDIENIVDRKCNTHDNDINESGRVCLFGSLAFRVLMRELVCLD